MNRALALTSLLVVSLLFLIPSVYATQTPSITIDVWMEYDDFPVKVEFPELILSIWGFGEFEMSGDFEDSGIVTATFELEGNYITDKWELKGTMEFTGSDGSTLEARIEGRFSSNWVGLPIIDCRAGEWTIINTSGRYAVLSGEGTFTASIASSWLGTTIHATMIGITD